MEKTYPRIVIIVEKAPGDAQTIVVETKDLPTDLVEHNTYRGVLLTLLQLPNGPALFGAYRDLLEAVHGLLLKLESIPRLERYEQLAEWLQALRRLEVELRPIIAAYAQAQALFKAATDPVPQMVEAQ